jgi:hypothetical protein
MNIQDLAPVAIAFVFIAVVIGVGSTVLESIQTNQVTNVAGCNSTNTTGCGVGYDATVNGLEGLGELGGWLPTIALVVAAAIVIGVLAYFRS